jgi:integrase
MEQKEQNINLLIEDCQNCLRELGYSEPCITWHINKWQKGIKPYLIESGISAYSVDVGEKFLRVTTPGLGRSASKQITRNIHILSDYLENGTIRVRISVLARYPLVGEIGKVAESFLESRKDLRRSVRTIHEQRRMLSYFVEGMAIKGKNSLDDITEKEIFNFIDSSLHCKDKHYYTIRMFCKFLYDKRFIKTDFLYLLNRNGFHIREKLPSVYTPTEIRQIEESVDQASSVGKRNYAMLLLATRLGLRASDICGLRFCNLDWDNNIICLVQNKTKRQIELPLLKDIGEALINYIKYGRPVSHLPQIFISTRTPYRTLDRAGLSYAIGQIIKDSGIKIGNRNFGPHAMRHSLASQMLYNGTSLPVISESLGHTNTQSTMEYLRVDLKSLAKCVLEVPLVPDNFYSQKGGVFYD